jgi:hypothetical protein
VSFFGGYLPDEHVAHALQRRLSQIAPALPVYTIGDGFAPPIGTPDPEILVWLEAHRCVLVTANRASMPVHLADHLLQGRHLPGLVQLPDPYSIGAIAENLKLIWEAAEEHDLIDRIAHLPL